MDVTLQTNSNGYKYALSVARRFEHAPEKVWRAITERDLLKQWFPCDVVGAWKPGSKLEFVFPPEQAADVPDEDRHGEVLAVDRPQLLEFRWGSHSMKFELKPDGDGCLFKLTERFNEKSWCARNAAGWDICIANLEHTLDDAEIPKFAPSAWRERFDHYAEKFKDVVGPRGGLAKDDPLLKLGRDE